MSIISRYFCIFCDFTCDENIDAFNHYVSHMFVQGFCETCDYDKLRVYTADPRDLSTCDKCNLEDYALDPNELLEQEPVIHYWISKFLSYQKKLLGKSYEKFIVVNRVCVECPVCRYFLDKYKSDGGDMNQIQYISDKKVEHIYQHMRYDPNSERLYEFVRINESDGFSNKIKKVEAFIEHCCDSFCDFEQSNNNISLTVNKATQFYIENIDTGLVLEIKDLSREKNAAIHMSAYNGGRNQLWEYRNGMIHSALNNFALDINQGDSRSVITYPANGKPWQKWHFDADNTIRCEFRNLVLDVEHNSRDMCAKVTARNKHNRDNQLFQIVYV